MTPTSSITNPTQATGTSGASSSSSSSATSANGADQLTNESTFLQLLVAQIKNQDPMNPTDSMQFIGQLVQFSQLEQLLGINQNITTLVKDVAPANQTPTTPTTPTNPTSPTSPTGN